MSHTILATGDQYRWLASEWHGGQWSPMYAYASSGSIVDGLVAEIDDDIAWCEANPDTDEADSLDDLRDFRSYIADQFECPGNTRYGHSHLSGLPVARCDACDYVCVHWDFDDQDDAGNLPHLPYHR